ncbi:hypothetical protein USB125703_01099 [Pseudoclavibacter triregionum]|nr:hypothetical protein USB125703_01099 [Pseudoclavibacter triregionum]
MSAPSAIAVIPARDEEGRVSTCLDSVLDAARRALSEGALERIVIALVAHRCADGTAAAARGILEAEEGPVESGRLAGIVVEDEDSETVGGARATGIRAARAELAALAGGPIDPDRAWLFSTDADSVVPADWMTGHLERIAALGPGAAGARALVELADWTPSPAARRAYEAIIAAGMRSDGGHDHVYGANLAVRLSALDRAGGMPDVPVGEDQALTDRLAELGTPLAGTSGPIVHTSGRWPGRAAGGLGTLLGRLEEEAG